MEDMSLLRPQKRARQELSIQAELKARMEEAPTEKSNCNFAADIALAVSDEALDEEVARHEKKVALWIKALAAFSFKALLAHSNEELARTEKWSALVYEGLALACQELALACKEPSNSYEVLALSHEAFAHSYKVRAAINWFPPWSVSLSDWVISSDSFPSKSQSNLKPQTPPPQLQLQQQLVGLDLQNCHQQILLLSATDVFETLVLRLNHYFEEWKKARSLRSDPSIPASYSDMVYTLLKSQLSPCYIEAMDYVASAYLRDLEMRGYGPAIELKEALRQDLIAFLTKAKGEGGRNDVAHPFSTSVKQYWKSSSQTPGKVRCLSGIAIDSLTQSQKDYRLRILDLLSNRQNLPECYRDLAQVAFPLQIFFLRDVLEKSKVKVEIVGDQ